MKFVGAGPQRHAERYAAGLFTAIAVILAFCAFTLSQRGRESSRARLLPRPQASAPAVADQRVPGPNPTPADPASPLRPIMPGGAALAAPPVSIAIPAIGVAARVVDLGLDSTGALIPPSDVETVGWYDGGPAPGAVGPAVLAGHVDSSTGPAVFWKLRELLPGDQLSVTGTDGAVHRFVVTKVEQYAKDHFPTDAVYGIQAAPVLRLVTCGGTFDRSTGHYRDNVVVYADAVAG